MAEVVLLVADLSLHAIGVVIAITDLGVAVVSAVADLPVAAVLI